MKPTRRDRAGVSRCRSCGHTLSAVTEDRDWPGLCVSCVHAGSGPMHVIAGTRPVDEPPAVDRDWAARQLAALDDNRDRACFVLGFMTAAGCYTVDGHCTKPRARVHARVQALLDVYRLTRGGR